MRYGLSLAVEVKPWYLAAWRNLSKINETMNMLSISTEATLSKSFQAQLTDKVVLCMVTNLWL